MSAHKLRDQLGSQFEAMASKSGLDIRHGTCDCDSTSCAYADSKTGWAFAGFVMSFEWMASKNAVLFVEEKIE